MIWRHIQSSLSLLATATSAASVVLVAAGCSTAPVNSIAPADDTVAATDAALHLGSNKPSLPSSFELTGCDADRLCQLVEANGSYQAVCDGGKTVLGLTVSSKVERLRRKQVVSWTAPDGAACSAELKDGQFAGSCTLADASCEIASKAPLPSPRCVELPKHLTFAGCDLPFYECDVTQTACNWQASCENGSVFVSGRATAAGARWDRENGDRCTGTLADGTLSGTCAPRTTGTPPEGTPAPVSCDFTASQPGDTPPAPTCTALPNVFAIKGCGGTSLCNVIQRGCIWEAHCGDDVYAGRGRKSVYEYTSANGAACAVVVRNGKLIGECHDRRGICLLHQIEAVPSRKCVSVPQDLFVSGCGLEGECKVIQSGCDWQASCNDDAVFYNGTATQDGILLPTVIDDVAFTCQATLGQDGALVGTCGPTDPDPSAPVESCDFNGGLTPPPEATTP